MRIICLANSRKLQGRCVAGKEIENYKWIRPISSYTEHGELSIQEITCDDNKQVKILDIIDIPILKPVPEYYQPENILIDVQPWKKVGEYPYDKLNELLDRPENIWMLNQPDPYDRISDDYLRDNPIDSSLLLIQPQEIILKTEISFGRKKLRALFSYNDIEFNLGVTDIEYENLYLNRVPGDYPLNNNIYLVLSLGGPYQGYCYKLVVSIISN